MVFLKSAAASGGNDESKIREDFWRTVKKAARHVPFIEDVVAAYYCALDKQTPLRVKGILFAALGYFILPADTIPDVIFGLGFHRRHGRADGSAGGGSSPPQAGASGSGERGAVAGLSAVGCGHLLASILDAQFCRPNSCRFRGLHQRPRDLALSPARAAAKTADAGPWPR